MAKITSKKLPKTSKKITLIVTDDASPSIKVSSPATIEIVEINAITPESKKVDLIAARLCGYGSNVCLALVEL